MLALGCAAWASGSPAWGAAETPERDPIDREALAQLQSSQPHAAELLETGENQLRAGNAAKGAELFVQAAGEAPKSALVARRVCQSLTDLGRAEEGLPSCRRAIELRGSALDARATVAALMSRERPPTPSDVIEAATLARSAAHTMPFQPWGYAALCEIAARLGDREMLESCTSDLERVAPDHYETRYFERLKARGESVFGALAGWALLLLALIGTIAHAVVRRLRHRGAASSAAAAMFLVILTAGTRANADPERDMLGELPINDSDPESSVPTPQKRDSDPMAFGTFLMDLSFKAEKAQKRGDHATALKYYRALAKAVPDRSVAFARTCDEYEALGDWAKAVQFCRAAVALEGATLADSQHYVRLVLGKTMALSASEVEDVTEIVKQLGSDGSTRVAAAEMECELGVRTSSTEHLQSCTSVLKRARPNDTKTIAYEWALAIQQKDFAKARDLIDHAKQTSMRPEAIQDMESATKKAQSFWTRVPRRWLFGASGVILAAAIAVLLVARRRPSVRSA
jgi:tetratricopeptide (TPR) repeat protein